MNFTIVDYYGPQISKCGYCKGSQCSIGHGMHAYTMTTQDYQDLIDRGWRRSGHYCYKQDNKITCCPNYTIKCDALDFKLSKSHKKIIKRMNRFLRDGKRDKNEEVTLQATTNDKSSSEGNADVGGTNGDCVQAPNVPLKDINLDVFAQANVANKQPENKVKVDKQKSQNVKINTKTANDDDTPDNSRKSGDGVKPPCKKAKQMRLERSLAKQAAKGLTPTVIEKKVPKNQEKSLKHFLNDAKPDDKHKLKLNIIHVESEEFYKTLSTTYALYKKYQTDIHNDAPTDESNYLDFLQRSPLKLSKPSDGPPCGYGSFHQQYWLDDQLIAVAVIDILPYCVSSVYFFYDPDYSFLSLGTYSSLREIELVQEFASIVPSLKYYYMGFYIHSCPKMRYKGKLPSSYLLCPETYTWHPLTDEIRSKLDICKYQRFNDDKLAKDANEFKEQDMNLVLLLINQRTYVKYGQYKQEAGDDDRFAILEYGKLVGKPLAHRMLYVKM